MGKGVWEMGRCVLHTVHIWDQAADDRQWQRCGQALSTFGSCCVDEIYGRPIQAFGLSARRV